LLLYLSHFLTFANRSLKSEYTDPCCDDWFCLYNNDRPVLLAASAKRTILFDVEIFSLEENLSQLQLVQNAAVRLVTQTKKREHITSKRKSLHWLPIRQRVMYKIAVLSYQCVNGTAPSYLCKVVSPRSVNRRLRNYSEISRDLGVPVKLPGAYGLRVS
jgi:hypothetical protein